jgi:uncharacterized protein YggE
MRPLTIPVLLIAWCFMAFPSAAPAETNQDGTVSGTGVVTLHPLPNKLRAQIQLQASGKSVEAAMEKLKTLQDAAKTRLGEMKANPASISFSNPRVVDLAVTPSYGVSTFSTPVPNSLTPMPYPATYSVPATQTVPPLPPRSYAPPYSTPPSSTPPTPPRLNPAKGALLPPSTTSSEASDTPTPDQTPAPYVTRYATPAVSSVPTPSDPAAPPTSPSTIPSATPPSTLPAPTPSKPYAPAATSPAWDPYARPVLSAPGGYATPAAPLSASPAFPSSQPVEPQCWVYTTLTAEWAIEAKDASQTMVALESLRKKLTADLPRLQQAAPTANSNSSASEGNASGVVPSIPGSTPAGWSPAMPSSPYGPTASYLPTVSGPMFLYVAVLSERERKEALTKAFAQARQQASELAEVAGAECGPIATLSHSGTNGRSNLPPYANGPRVENENEVVGVNPESLMAAVQINATFHLVPNRPKQ